MVSITTTAVQSLRQYVCKCSRLCMMTHKCFGNDYLWLVAIVPLAVWDEVLACALLFRVDSTGSLCACVWKQHITMADTSSLPPEFMPYGNSLKKLFVQYSCYPSHSCHCTVLTKKFHVLQGIGSYLPGYGRIVADLMHPRKRAFLSVVELNIVSCACLQFSCFSLGLLIVRYWCDSIRDRVFSALSNFGFVQRGHLTLQCHHNLPTWL